MKQMFRALGAITLTLIFGGLGPFAMASEPAAEEGTLPSVLITCEGAVNLSSGEINPVFRVETLLDRSVPSAATERRWRMAYNIRPGQKVLAVTSGWAKLYALEDGKATLIGTSPGLSGGHESMEILPHDLEEKRGGLKLNFDMIETGVAIPGGGRLLQLELWPSYERSETGEVKIRTGKNQGSGMGIIKAYGNNPPVEEPYSLVNCTRQEVK